MKRTWIAVILLTFLAGSFSACQSSEGARAEVTPSATPVAQDTPEATDTPKVTVTSEPVPTEAEKIEVTLSNSQELTADYTTVKDIPVEKGTYIAVVAKSLDSSYWKAVKKGAQTAVKELNQLLGYSGNDKIRITFEGPSDNADVDAQINIIDAVLADNPTVLCLSAIDMQSCGAQLETAEENGIPVVIIDSGVQNNLVASACATNNYTAGAEAARKLAQAVRDSGKVAVMAHQQTSQSSQDRVAGFLEEISANHPNITIVETSYENTETSTEDMVTEILTQHPDLAGYFCTNEGTSTKTLDAIGKAGRDEIMIVGFDADASQQKAVKDGSVYGIICQNPYGMGYASMVAAFRLAAHLPVDAYISSGYQWIDKSNIDLSENQKYLYE